MQLYIRRILLVISCMAFAIIAPLIILYAMGYRPGTSSLLAPPVGVALVEATPRKAIVEVNGKSYGTLPRSIPNLVPGQTTIRVTKEGYTPWEKRMEIKPATATDVRSIKLIPSIVDRDTLHEDSVMFTATPSSSFIATVNSAKKLAIYDDTGLPITNELPLQHIPTTLAWSPNETYLLAFFPKQPTEVFRIENKKIEQLKNKLPRGSTNVHWDPTKVGKVFFLTPEQSLVSYATASGVSETILSRVNTYAIHNRTLIIQTLDNSFVLKQIGSANETILFPDTKKGIQKIIPSSNEYIAILYVDGELQLATKQGEMRHIASGIHGATWSPNGSTLLIQSSSEELNVYIPEGFSPSGIPSGELHLVARLSHPLIPLGWLPDSQHILYETNGNIILSEIDTRDHAIQNTILKAGVPNSPVTVEVEQEGKSVLALQKNSENQSLVRAWLVTKEDR